MSKQGTNERITREELEGLTAEEVPDRAVMSVMPVLDLIGPSMLPPVLPAETPEDASPE